MSSTTTPHSIPETFASTIKQLWEPHLVATVNDQHVKIARIDGGFIWHDHADSDELFHLLSGKLSLEMDDGEKPFRTVVMKPGDVFVVPKGVRHRPVAENAEILMIEKAGTVNTGGEDAPELRRQPKDVR